MQYTLKNKPSDFIVVEDMDIEHSGNGEHLWLWVEKQNLTTDVAKSLLGKAFDVQLRNVSAAGKKDRHAVTRQWVSLQLPGKAPGLVEEASQILEAFFAEKPLYEGESLVILEAAVHSKKCQTGCHKGNRFEIVVETEQAINDEQLSSAASTITAQGFPNAFGDQRFGRDKVGLPEVDAALCKIHPKTKPGRLKPKESWTCSQARSVLFNAVLEFRQEKGLWDKAVLGDVMNLSGSQSCFCVGEDEDLGAIQSRIDEGDIIPTGPLFGRVNPQMQPSAEIGEIEAEVWSRLSPQAQKTLLNLQSASRRPLWVKAKALCVEVVDAGFKTTFWLPKGAYATECVDAIVKSYQQMA